MNKFIIRLEELIKNSNKSIEQISEDLKINKSSLYRYLKNERIPSAIITKDIANYFNISVDYLLGLTDNPITHIIKTEDKPLPEQAVKELKDYEEFLRNKYSK